MKKNRTIRNAFEAHWFLYNHPKMNVPARAEVTKKEASKFEKEGFLITRDIGGKCYLVFRHIFSRALDKNLDIFYTKTNKAGGHGRVDNDKSKNIHVECWLEFGPMCYGYAYSGTDTPAGDWDDTTTLIHGHDTRLDTGGVTFDEALIRLAKLVLKFYGDYSEVAFDGVCGSPVCADCNTVNKLLTRTGKSTVSGDKK
jgi:hypothetical protein